MTRIIVPLALALTLVFGYFSINAKQQVSAAVGAEILDMLSGNVDENGESANQSSYEYEISKSTHDLAIVTLVYGLLAETTLVLSLMKIKTKTVKIMSIIGMAIGGIFLVFNFMPLSSPGKFSFDETWSLYYLFGTIMLAVFSVITVHAFRKKNQNNFTPGVAV